MSKTLTASDRSRLIKLAITMPAGSPERKAILKGLSKSAVSTGAAIAGKFHLFRAVEARNPEMVKIIDEVGKTMPRHRRVVQGWKEGRVSDRDMATLLWNLWDQEGLLKALGVDPDWKPSLRSASASRTKSAAMKKLTIEVNADRKRVSDTFPKGQPYVEFDGRERYYLVSPPGSSRGGKFGEWRNAYGVMPMEAVLPLVAFMYGK